MPTTSNRRTFLKHSALLGTGAVLLGRMPLFAAAAAPEGAIGDLTALALVDDALHLINATDGLAPAMDESLDFGINVYEPLPGNAAFFGRLMPARPDDVVGLLGAVREGWATRDEEDNLKLKLALASGWLVQRAGADVIAPSLADASDADAARTYQDTAVLRARSRHLAETASPEEVASLLHEMGPRTLVRFHTLIPDYDDGGGWITRLADWRARHAAQLEAYARAYTDGPSAMYRRFVTDPNFYDPDDPIVRLAEQVRRQEAPADVDLPSVAARPHASLYGKALARGIEHLLSVNDYLEGTLDDQAVEERLARA